MLNTKTYFFLNLRLALTYRLAAKGNNSCCLNLINLKLHNSPYNTRHNEACIITQLRTSYGIQSLEHNPPESLSQLLNNNITPQFISKKTYGVSFMFTEFEFISHLCPCIICVYCNHVKYCIIRWKFAFWFGFVLFMSHVFLLNLFICCCRRMYSKEVGSCTSRFFPPASCAPI